MSLSISELVPSRTSDQWFDLLLGVLQGRGIVSQTGLGSGKVTISGAPANTWDVEIEIAGTGELGTGAFFWRLVDPTGAVTEDGIAYSIPGGGTYVLGSTGITLTFANGTDGDSFVAGDKYTFSLTTPTFPVTSWQEGGVARTLLHILAYALGDSDATMGRFAAGRLLDYVSTIGLSANSFMDQLGLGFYNLPRKPSVSTTGTVRLTDAGVAGPFTINVGDVWVSDSAGRRYNNLTGGTLTLSGTLDLQFQAEKPGSAYNVGNNTITILLTSLAGVTVTNPAGSGSWIVTPGVDAESNAAYIERCKERWPSLAPVATEDVYKLWAATASDEVTRTQPFVDGVNPGQVDVYIAGAAGAVSGGAVTDVQDYIDERIPLTAIAVVSNASEHVVTVTADIYVTAARLTAAQVAISAALDSYINNLPIGGAPLASGTGVSKERIIAAIAGADGVQDITLAAPGADVTLTATEVATLTFNPTWHTV